MAQLKRPDCSCNFKPHTPAQATAPNHALSPRLRRLLLSIEPDFQLAVVLRLIEMPLRLRDQAVRAYRPFLISADTHGLACTSWAGVCPGQGPAVDSLVPRDADPVHRNDHIGEGGHEALRRRSDRCPTHIRCPIIDLQRTPLSKERRNAGRVLAAPSSRVSRSELLQLCGVHRHLLRAAGGEHP